MLFGRLRVFFRALSDTLALYKSLTYLITYLITYFVGAGDVNLWLLMTTTITRCHIIIIIIITRFLPPTSSCPARLVQTVRRCPRATQGPYRRPGRWLPAALTAPCRLRLLGPTVPGKGQCRQGTLTAVTGWPVSVVVINIAFIYSIIQTLLITSAVSIFINTISSSNSNWMWYRPSSIPRYILLMVVRQMYKT